MYAGARFPGGLRPGRKAPRKVFGHAWAIVTYCGHEADGFALAVEDLEAPRRTIVCDADARRPVQGAGARGRPSGIVVARRVHHGDLVVLQPLCFLQKEALRLEGESLPVEQVSGDQERVNVLPNGEVDGSDERRP